MMEYEYIAVLLFALGAILRPTLLYLREWLNTNVPFDYRYLIGQIVGVLIVLIPLLDSWAQQLEGASLTLAPVLGWAAADIGREIQKTFVPKMTDEGKDRRIKHE